LILVIEYQLVLEWILLSFFELSRHLFNIDSAVSFLEDSQQSISFTLTFRKVEVLQSEVAYSIGDQWRVLREPDSRVKARLHKLN